MEIKSARYAVYSSGMIMELRQLSGAWTLASLSENVFPLSLSTILTAAAIVGSSVEVGVNWSRTPIVVKLLHTIPNIMHFGTRTCCVHTLLSNMGGDILYMTYIIPFVGRSWRLTRAMVGSSRERPLALETTVTG